LSQAPLSQSRFTRSSIVPEILLALNRPDEYDFPQRIWIHGSG
jgi:hypothetical protein